MDNGKAPNPTRVRTLKEGTLKMQVRAEVNDDEPPPDEIFVWEDVSLDLTSEEEFEPGTREWVVRKTDMTIFALDDSGMISYIKDQVNLQQRFPSIAYNSSDTIFHLNFVGKEPIIFQATDDATRQMWVNLIRKTAFDLHPNEQANSVNATSVYMQRVSQASSKRTDDGTRLAVPPQDDERLGSEDLFWDMLSQLQSRRLDDQRVDANTIQRRRSSLSSSPIPLPTTKPELRRNLSTSKPETSGRASPTYKQSSSLDEIASSSTPPSPPTKSRLAALLTRTPSDKDRKSTIQFGFRRFRSRSDGGNESRQKSASVDSQKSIEFASELLNRYDEYLSQQQSPVDQLDTAGSSSSSPSKTPTRMEEPRSPTLARSVTISVPPKSRPSLSQIIPDESRAGMAIGTPATPTAVGILTPRSEPKSSMSSDGTVRLQESSDHYSVVHSAAKASASIGEDRKLLNLLGRVQNRNDDQRVAPPVPKVDDLSSIGHSRRSKSADLEGKRRRDTIKQQIEDLYGSTPTPGAASKLSGSRWIPQRKRSIDQPLAPPAQQTQQLAPENEAGNNDNENGAGDDSFVDFLDVLNETSAPNNASSPGRPALRLTGARGTVSEGLNGMLYKRVPSTFGRSNWIKRWFVIKEGLLMYRRKAQEDQLHFAANLLNAKVAQIDIADRSWCFEVITSYKSFVLQAPSESQMKSWIQGIQRVGDEIARWRPDGKVHFKCSYKDATKRLCVTRNISLQAFVDFVMSEFEVREPSIISYVDGEDVDLIFLRTQNDLDEAFLEYDHSHNLKMYLTEKNSNVTARHVSKHGHRRQQPKQPTTKINWIQGELIGSGSTGQVYLGLNIDTGRLMAVKQVEHRREKDRDTSLNGRVLALVKEMEVLRSLHHPNIVDYIGMEHEGDVTNVFLEYVPGGSIHALLTKFGSFDEKLIRVYIRQVLSGLRYLHNNGLIHRDIKGANILVDTTGIVKLADFGMASKILAGVNIRDANAKLDMAGTPYWMAPEVIKRVNFGKSADIWSVGCTVIEMATGKPPWNHFSQEVAAMFHIANAKEPPKSPSWLSTNAQDFLKQCLSLNPADRPDVDTLMKHLFVADRADEASLSSSSSSRRDSVHSEIHAAASGKGVSSSSSAESVHSANSNATAGSSASSRSPPGALTSAKQLESTLAILAHEQGSENAVVQPASLEDVYLHTGRISATRSGTSPSGTLLSVSSSDIVHDEHSSNNTSFEDAANGSQKVLRFNSPPLPRAQLRNPSPVSSSAKVSPSSKTFGHSSEEFIVAAALVAKSDRDAVPKKLVVESPPTTTSSPVTSATAGATTTRRRPSTTSRAGTLLLDVPSTSAVAGEAVVSPRRRTTTKLPPKSPKSPKPAPEEAFNLDDAVPALSSDGDTTIPENNSRSSLSDAATTNSSFDEPPPLMPLGTTSTTKDGSAALKAKTSSRSQSPLSVVERTASVPKGKKSKPVELDPPVQLPERSQSLQIAKRETSTAVHQKSVSLPLVEFRTAERSASNDAAGLLLVRKTTLRSRITEEKLASEDSDISTNTSGTISPPPPAVTPNRKQALPRRSSKTILIAPPASNDTATSDAPPTASSHVKALSGDESISETRSSSSHRRFIDPAAGVEPPTNISGVDFSESLRIPTIPELPSQEYLPVTNSVSEKDNDLPPSSSVSASTATVSTKQPRARSRSHAAQEAASFVLENEATPTSQGSHSHSISVDIGTPAPASTKTRPRLRSRHSSNQLVAAESSPNIMTASTTSAVSTSEDADEPAQSTRNPRVRRPRRQSLPLAADALLSPEAVVHEVTSLSQSSSTSNSAPAISELSRTTKASVPSIKSVRRTRVSSNSIQRPAPLEDSATSAGSELVLSSPILA